MCAAPPVLPEKTLQRILGIARADGWSIVIVAALGGLVSLVQGSWFGATVAFPVILAGAAELHGRGLLLRGKERGVDWLVGAQLFLLGVIWAYLWWRWRFFDADEFWARLPAYARAEIDRQLVEAGGVPDLDRPLLLEIMNRFTCGILVGVTLLYQGGLALYYAWQRTRVREALASPSQPPAANQSSL